MRAFCLIKEEPHYRREAFVSGLQKLGYKVFFDVDLRDIRKDDLLVIWNRYGHFDEFAKLYEAKGCKVIVVENGYLGVQYNDKVWYSIALSHHNGYGKYRLIADRFFDQNLKFSEWKTTGREVVVLAQRGIGEKSIASPDNWEYYAKDLIEHKTGLPVRIRQHPGLTYAIDLAEDLKNAKFAVTWGSGAGIKAITLGVPVVHGLQNWIAKDSSLHISEFDMKKLFRGDRTKTFCNVFSAMWNLQEIYDARPFVELLNEN